MHKDLTIFGKPFIPPLLSTLFSPENETASLETLKRLYQLATGFNQHPMTAQKFINVMKLFLVVCRNAKEDIHFLYDHINGLPEGMKRHFIGAASNNCKVTTDHLKDQDFCLRIPFSNRDLLVAPVSGLLRLGMALVFHNNQGNAEMITIPHIQFPQKLLFIEKNNTAQDNLLLCIATYLTPTIIQNLTTTLTTTTVLAETKRCSPTTSISKTEEGESIKLREWLNLHRNKLPARLQPYYSLLADLLIGIFLKYHAKLSDGNLIIQFSVKTKGEKTICSVSPEQLVKFIDHCFPEILPFDIKSTPKTKKLHKAKKTRKSNIPLSAPKKLPHTAAVSSPDMDNDSDATEDNETYAEEAFETKEETSQSNNEAKTDAPSTIMHTMLSPASMEGLTHLVSNFQALHTELECIKIIYTQENLPPFIQQQALMGGTARIMDLADEMSVNVVTGFPHSVANKVRNVNYHAPKPLSYTLQEVKEMAINIYNYFKPTMRFSVKLHEQLLVTYHSPITRKAIKSTINSTLFTRMVNTPLKSRRSSSIETCLSNMTYQINNLLKYYDAIKTRIDWTPVEIAIIENAKLTILTAFSAWTYSIKIVTLKEYTKIHLASLGRRESDEALIMVDIDRLNCVEVTNYRHPRTLFSPNKLSALSVFPSPKLELRSIDSSSATIATMR